MVWPGPARDTARAADLPARMRRQASQRSRRLRSWCYSGERLDNPTRAGAAATPLRERGHLAAVLTTARCPRRLAATLNDPQHGRLAAVLTTARCPRHSPNRGN